MAKVTINKDLNQIWKWVIEFWSLKTRDIVKEEILKAIRKGVSPVKGQRRFPRYSESYIKQMKRKSFPYSGKRPKPVNLTLSGKMLNSLKARANTKKGEVTLWFTDEKAKYHNDLGAGKSKVIRKMLPDENQEFSRAIERRIEDELRSVIKRHLG